MENRISVEQAAALINTKKEMARAMRLNGYYIPSETSSILTIEYMHSVRAGKICCPRFEMMNKRHCEFPPTMNELVDECLAVTKRAQLEHHSNFGIKPPVHVPDKQWMLDLIGLLEPEHKYFQRDYRPVQHKPSMLQQTLDNSDGFYTGLPASKAKGAGVRRKAKVVSKDEKDRLEMERL